MLLLVLSYRIMHFTWHTFDLISYIHQILQLIKWQGEKYIIHVEKV